MVGTSITLLELSEGVLHYSGRRSIAPQKTKTLRKYEEYSNPSFRIKEASLQDNLVLSLDYFNSEALIL